jgi:hypothetical protein
LLASWSSPFTTLVTVLVFGVAYLALAALTVVAGIFYLPYWAWKHRTQRG